MCGRVILSLSRFEIFVRSKSYLFTSWVESNLIAGMNNSGKTSFLEALFLLASGGRPDIAINSNVVRAQNDQLRGPVETLSDTYWKPLFNELKFNKVIDISAKHSQRGSLSLSIEMERPKVVKIPLDHSIGGIKRNHLNGPTLLLTYREDDKGPVQGRATIGAAPDIQGAALNIQLEDGDISVPFETIILLSNLANHRDDALRLARLRKHKQGQLILAALQMIEPQLVSIERPHFHSEVQHRPFPQRGRSPSGGNGRKAWSAAPGHRGSGPGTAVVPSVCRLSGLSGQRNASAGAGRVRPGVGRAQPDRSPDGRGPEIHSTPSRRSHARRWEAVARRQGGRASWNTSAGVR